MASVAVTVKVDESPELIEAGLAETLTVGAGFTGGVLPTAPPHPLNRRDSPRLENKHRQGKNPGEGPGNANLCQSFCFTSVAGRGKGRTESGLFASTRGFRLEIAIEGRASLATDIAQ